MTKEVETLDLSAFLTGSKRYGTPRPDSDIDLAVFMTPEEAPRFGVMAVVPGQFEYGDGAGQYRFGDLNLLIFTNPATFSAWKAATVELTVRAPVTREHAVETIKAAVAATNPVEATT